MATVEIELYISCAHDLKNVNWKHGDLKPYVAAWIENGPSYSQDSPESKRVRTEVDINSDTNPTWEQEFTLPVLKEEIRDAQLMLEVRHNRHPDEDDESPTEEDGVSAAKKEKKRAKKAKVGWASLLLHEVADAGGFDERLDYTVKLERPSGRPQGKLELSIRLRERSRWSERSGAERERSRNGYGEQRDWYPGQSAPSGAPYSSPYPTQPYPAGGYYPGYGGPPQAPAYAPPPYGGYPSPPPYAAPPNEAFYGQPPPPNYGYYGQPTPSDGGYQYGPPPAKSKFGGMGTGLAVGALAGAVGGLALNEYIDHKEDEAAEEQAEEDAEAYGLDDY
ncbi:hypothetical protein KP509_23G022200 [Ceratopteris richardii]|uniref:C2 domain-containing protein n=1 Tax=Ceratopteris richardii TaxID=49495 RepID=A0A8T2RXR7_CERRI|nr:hypothetical protein KP509_23G022200 [Ceratopteris richardii]